jgi:beta-lactamase superfamily II metal-dependent hydrolase
LEQGAERTKVKARNRTGWVDNSSLGGTSLMEYYYIDVGQGDGVLIKTPDFRHILIDGGWPRKNQDTGKNAADFVDWKFKKDYGLEAIELDAMVCSHNDQDHYGGLWDMLNIEQSAELDCEAVYVKDFYHAGLGHWKKASGSGTDLGEHDTDGEFFVQLMGDRPAVTRALNGTGPQLGGEWAHFMATVRDAKWKDGTATRIQRLSHRTEHLPGFETNTANGPAIRVLGPVEFDVNGTAAIRRFGSKPGENTNGCSILLRVDHGRSRTLLTGDLNKKSQKTLLDDYAGSVQELECDVSKACHHGSQDVSYAFLQTLRPAVTIISSGDNEGHDHPRPSIIAASATTGYFKMENDELQSPLVFSTELARSTSFGKPYELTAHKGTPEAETIKDAALAKAEVAYVETKSGDRTGRKGARTLNNSLLVAGLIYGLVNVRTDGETILCATLDEKDSDWRVHKLVSRF